MYNIIIPLFSQLVTKMYYHIKQKSVQIFVTIVSIHTYYIKIRHIFNSLNIIGDITVIFL